MGYDYDRGNSNAEAAGEIPDGEGACPPTVLEYRIYPVANFNLFFNDPPDSVDI